VLFLLLLLLSTIEISSGSSRDGSEKREQHHGVMGGALMLVLACGQWLKGSTGACQTSTPPFLDQQWHPARREFGVSITAR